MNQTNYPKVFGYVGCIFSILIGLCAIVPFCFLSIGATVYFDDPSAWAQDDKMTFTALSVIFCAVALLAFLTGIVSSFFVMRKRKVAQEIEYIEV